MTDPITDTWVLSFDGIQKPVVGNVTGGKRQDWSVVELCLQDIPWLLHS